MKSNLTVTLMNPWSQAIVEWPVADILRNSLAAYPWPDELRYELDGLYDTDSEWLGAAVERLGAREAGRIILGS